MIVIMLLEKLLQSFLLMRAASVFSGIAMSYQPPFTMNRALTSRTAKNSFIPIRLHSTNGEDTSMLLSNNNNKDIGDLATQQITVTNRIGEGSNDSHIMKKTMVVPWVIVGGGIHGVHISARLIGEGGIPSEHIRIIDSNESLLYQWKSRTASTGMEYLRSTATHHLDIDTKSLTRQYDTVSNKKKRKKNKSSKQQQILFQQDKKKPLFSNDYKRPRLDIFNQHCDSVIDKYNLNSLHIQGTVTSIVPHDNDDYIQVQINNDYYYAQNIILALGNDEPLYTDWVEKDDIQQGYVHHILDHPLLNKQSNNNYHDPTILFNDDNNEKQIISLIDNDDDIKDVAVIGGGITAAHKALQLAYHPRNSSFGNRQPTKKRVHLISRSQIKEQQFDTHSDWMMDQADCQRSLQGGGEGTPKRQVQFANCSSYQQRRQIISQERVPGTVTTALHRGNNGLCYAIDNGDIQYHCSEVIHKRDILYPKVAKAATATTTTDNNHNSHTPNTSTTTKTRKRMELSLSCGTKLEVDQVLLATGFGKKLPGGKLIQDLLKKSPKFEISDFCGYPIVDTNLTWWSGSNNNNKSRIFVAGALAELELGPSARNIAGARLAAERILQSIHR